MLKQLNRHDLDVLLRHIAAKYRLQVPTLLADGTRQLAAFGSGALALSGPQLQRKPTSFFFPQTQKLLTIATDGSINLPTPPEKPLALFGLDCADLAGIAFLDRFFLAAPADDVYLRERQNALLISLTGMAGPEQGLLPLTGGNCDVELIATQNGWLARGFTEIGCSLIETFTSGTTEDDLKLQKLSAEKRQKIDQLQRASDLLRADQVPDSFWEEIASRCLLCTGCNLACPTCSCFCVQDRQTKTATERSRVWDSCQLDAFMREASGHNPLGTEALRTRRRIHHKLAADVERWGELGCIGCGRCDRACPTGIGMFAVVEKMLAQFGE